MSTHRLSPAQAEVAARVVAEESARRRHLVVHLSGAHAYGFPSVDSDLDLKSVHIERTEVLLGLARPRLTFNRLEIVDGIEIDYTSNELVTALSGVLSGDGNMLERLLATAPLAADPVLGQLRPLVLASLSRRFHRHYAGFARAQARRLREAAPTAKQLLYVLRTATTGTHLLLERQCEPDLTVLAERYDLAEVPELALRKQAAEGGVLDGAWLPRIEPLVQRALAMLDDAAAKSPLPAEPVGGDALEAWMVQLRLSAR